MSRWQHGYPWPSLAIFPYRSSPQAGLLDNIPYPHIIAECMFLLVILLLHGHVWGSTRVHHRGITLTSIAAKIYNALLWNRIEPKINNILRKNQNSFRRNRSMTSQILTIRRILEGVQAKNLQATLTFVDFTKAFDSIHRGKMEQILLAYGIPKETVAAITILYRNTKVKVR